jgi:ketosteroid isomerase-like protein
MSGPRSSLPPLDDAVAFAKAVARVLSQMTGDPYGEPALSELQAGKEMIEEGLGNPVAFAHTVIDYYVQATGDFLYGTGEVSRGSYNLALSSAAVARSACEYAGIGWWLAEPGIPIGSRIARTARLVITTYNEGKTLLDSSELAQYEADKAVLVNWAQRNLSRKEKLPDATERFRRMIPAHGRKHYSRLSMLAHGDLTLVAQIVALKVAGRNEQVEEPWWRILLACSHGLSLAQRISELRDRPSEHLPGLLELHAYYDGHLTD